MLSISGIFAFPVITVALAKLVAILEFKMLDAKINPGHP